MTVKLGIMAPIVLMLFFLQKLVIACKSNIRETMNNVQSNSALKEDISALLENHSANNTIMVLMILTAENAAHYGANSNKEVTFTIPK